MERFEIQPLPPSSLPAVAAFLERQLRRPAEGPHGIRRRLEWLLLENPSAHHGDPDPLGLCLRDDDGAIRGLSLSFPATFLMHEQRLRALGGSSFYVDPPARSMGFYLFRKYLGATGYAFHFASTCNALSGEIWRNTGGCAVPDSDADYVVPLRLGVTLPAIVATKVQNKSALQMARLCGLAADPVLRFLTKPPAGLKIRPCCDWQKLSEIYLRHRPHKYITCERSAEYLEWRYGPTSPLDPCGVYLISDTLGNEGWFALREWVLLDVIWPALRMNFGDIFLAICRFASDNADVLLLRSRPDIDFASLRPWAIRRKLPVPQAFVITAKGAPRMPVGSLEYDDSDNVAWRFD